MIERWLTITEASRYSISDQGRVRNDRTGRILKLTPTKGYAMVTLMHEGVRMDKRVCRLVALAFVPNRDPESLIEVNHTDGVKANNVYTNLEWQTHSEQMLHAYAMGLKKPLTGPKYSGVNCRHSKLNLQEVSIIRAADLSAPGSTVAVARRFGITHGAVWKIRKNKVWRHAE